MTHPQVSYLFQILELGLLSKAISLISCTPFRVPFTGLYSSWPRVYPPSIAIHISYILRYIYFRFVPQTNLQPSHNLCHSSPPSKWLAPTRRKSYALGWVVCPLINDLTIISHVFLRVGHESLWPVKHRNDLPENHRFGQSVSSITKVSIINGSYRLIETEVELIMAHPQLVVFRRVFAMTLCGNQCWYPWLILRFLVLPFNQLFNQIYVVSGPQHLMI